MISESCNIDPTVKILYPEHVVLENCTIGAHTKLSGAFIYIGPGVQIGRHCRIQGNVFIPSNVIIDDNVFIGPGVTFCNDKYPPSHGKWKEEPSTHVYSFVSIGACAIIMPSVHLNRRCVIGAGAVVTDDVHVRHVVAGVPAKLLRRRLA